MTKKRHQKFWALMVQPHNESYTLPYEALFPLRTACSSLCLFANAVLTTDYILLILFTEFFHMLL